VESSVGNLGGAERPQAVVDLRALGVVVVKEFVLDVGEFIHNGLAICS
jgi:hypothetical protein